MSGSAIGVQKRLLEATARRCWSKFGYSETGLESSQRPPKKPQPRHDLLRRKLQPKSNFDLLRENPEAALEGRMRRIGIDVETIKNSASPPETASNSSAARRVGLERIIGRNELLSVRYLDLGKRAGQAASRITIRSSGEGFLGHGKGSLISPTLLMTNNHVIDSAALASITRGPIATPNSGYGIDFTN